MGIDLTHTEAARLLDADPRNADVVFPVANGQEINNEPNQNPGRSIINYQDLTLEVATTYHLPFQRVDDSVKAERAQETASAEK